MSSDEKSTIGASITSPKPMHLTLSQPTFQTYSTTSLAPTVPPSPITPTHPTSKNPFSPFYSHDSSGLNSSLVSVSDLEKGHATIAHTPAAASTRSLPSVTGKSSQYKQSLLCKSEAKQTRGFWRKLSKKQKVAVHVLIALVFVGAVTGLGVGVSKAMGTGLWKNANNTSAIGEGRS